MSSPFKGTIKGATYRIKTLPSGRRVRQAIWNGRVIETRELSRAKRTKTRKHLNTALRRIRR